MTKSLTESRSRDFCQIFDYFGFCFKKFGIGKKVSVSVSENLVLEKSLGIGFGQNFGIVIQWSRLTWSPALPSWAMPKRKKEYCFWNFHPFGVKWSYKESSKHVILYLNCTQARSGYHLFGWEYRCLCFNKFQKVFNFLPTYFLFIGSCLDQRERPWKDQDKPEKALLE